MDKAEAGPRTLAAIVVRDPAAAGGQAVFRGTDVPVTLVFEHLETGIDLNETLRRFPALDRLDVRAVVRAAGRLAAGEPAEGVAQAGGQKRGPAGDALSLRASSVG